MKLSESVEKIIRGEQKAIIAFPNSLFPAKDCAPWVSIFYYTNEQGEQCKVRLKIEKVVVMKLQSIGKKEVLDLGYPGAECYSEEEPCICAIEPFFDGWEELFGDSPLSYDNNPWVELMYVVLAEDGEDIARIS